MDKIWLNLIHQQEELIRDKAEEKEKEVCVSPFFGRFKQRGTTMYYTFILKDSNLH